MRVEWATGLGHWTIESDDRFLTMRRGRFSRHVEWAAIERVFPLEAQDTGQRDVPDDVLDAVVPGMSQLGARVDDHSRNIERLFFVVRKGRRCRSWYLDIPGHGPQRAAVLAELTARLGPRLETEPWSLFQARRAVGFGNARVVVASLVFLVFVAAAVFAILALREWVGI